MTRLELQELIHRYTHCKANECCNLMQAMEQAGVLKLSATPDKPSTFTPKGLVRSTAQANPKPLATKPTQPAYSAAQANAKKRKFF